MGPESIMETVQRLFKGKLESLELLQLSQQVQDEILRNYNIQIKF